MNRRTPISLRTLLLLLIAVGPLQAQTIFACAMMDTVVHDRCCCDEHGADDLASESDHEPCCERSLGVTVDQDGKHGTLTGKAAEVRPDADPPQILIVSFDALFSPRPLTVPVALHRFPTAGHSGSDTWLITRRLRI